MKETMKRGPHYDQILERTPVEGKVKNTLGTLCDAHRQDPAASTIRHRAIASDWSAAVGFGFQIM